MCSSAARACMAPVSASEWMATVLMPNSLQARITRKAISPRLATSTFLNTSAPLPAVTAQAMISLDGHEADPWAEAGLDESPGAARTKLNGLCQHPCFMGWLWDR